MSGFENFQSSENWMNRFRNFLIEKRCVSPKMDSSPSSSPTFDLDKDFQEILEAKCPSLKESFNNKENYKPISNKCSKQSLDKGIFSELNNSIMPMSPTSYNCLETTANDSFFYLEKICNKTISDPDSTIHSYVENMKKENSINISNKIKEVEEDAAIERLLTDDNIEGDYLPERTIFHVGDQTQLGDIEEPSGLWETTISDDALLQLSPTKRVGLLRPSTIIEETNGSYSGSENSRNNSTGFSFKTALKSTETTTYETANDTIRSEICKKEVNPQVDGNYSKYNIFSNTELSLKKNKTSKDSAFFDTISSAEHHSEQFNSKNTIDDISSCILDDSLNNYVVNKVVDHDSLEKENAINDITKDMSLEDDSYIEISDDEDDMNNGNKLLNDGFSMHSINEDNSDVMDETLSDANGINVSCVFNDTLEEVDYILQQGMKMMKNSSGLPISIRKTTANLATLNVCTPSPKKTPRTPNTIISKQSSNEKSDLFKKPNFATVSRVPQPKTLVNVKKSNPYANIISPVGAYIKNTPKTPIISNIRETTVRSLDYGQISKNILPPKQMHKNSPKEFMSSLPKKAYTSAQYREVRDERTPLNIPGGNKIHRYLQPALLPAVARHEGKIKLMKTPEDNSAYDKFRDSTINKTVDSTLADLSVMSGDVSVYTLVDAQNFGNNNEHK